MSRFRLNAWPLFASFPSCSPSVHRRARGAASGHRPPRFTHRSRVFPPPRQTVNWGQTREELCSFRSGETTAALSATDSSLFPRRCLCRWMIPPCYPHFNATITPGTSLKHCFLSFFFFLFCESWMILFLAAACPVIAPLKNHPQFKVPPSSSRCQYWSAEACLSTSLILEHAWGISAIDSSISLTSINKLSGGMTFKLPQVTRCGMLRSESMERAEKSQTKELSRLIGSQNHRCIKTDRISSEPHVIDNDW